MKRILINASNLHTGGAVQVATSFIFELSKMFDRLYPCEIFVYVSTEVNSNLISSGFKRESFDNYHIFDVYGLQTLKTNFAEKFYGYDLIFTIFGPLYTLKYLKNHIVGFAQPWIIYPDNDVMGRLSFGSRMLFFIKYLIQWWFFKKADRLVVELEHVKNRLFRIKNYPVESVDVVYNCISALYSDSSLWLPLPIINDLDDDGVNIGFLTRDYPHKNILFLIEVSRELKLISNVKYRFFVTLPKNQWIVHSSEFKNTVINIGDLNVAQCPTFYNLMDGIIFPSLLECFSASPLEAMAMRRPLFASDRGFVRDNCGDNAIYIDPLNAQQTARKIDDWFSRTDLESRSAFINKAFVHSMSLPGSIDRAKAYIDIINNKLIS
jgi:glycosyltransferase involved in cell wall biosynthesis